jgi:hypothetical protein
MSSNFGDSSAAIINKTEFKETDKEKFDFEDLAVIGDTVYALWSHGAIFKIVNKKKGVTSERTKTWLKKDNNTEGLAYDPVSGNLLVACKDDAGLEDQKNRQEQFLNLIQNQIRLRQIHL